MMQLRALIDQVDFIALVDPGVGRVYTKITITPEDLRALGQAPTKYDGPSGHLTGEEYRQLIGQSQTPATSRPEQPHELPTPEVGSIVCFTPPPRRRPHIDSLFLPVRWLSRQVMNSADFQKYVSRLADCLPDLLESASAKKILHDRKKGAISTTADAIAPGKEYINICISTLIVLCEVTSRRWQPLFGHIWRRHAQLV